MAARRVLVVGLDCAPPQLVFDRWRDAMPYVSEMMRRGMWGPLRSTMPPITVPAWASMTSGRDPGELGLYGFRNRHPGRYELALADARDVRVKRIWDYASEAGCRAASLFVPLTYPPSPLRGHMVSGCMTPGADSEWAFPTSLRRELEARHGPYDPDVRAFRTTDCDRVIDEAHRTARQHFAMAKYVWEQKRPDLMMMVEMGPDRIHHAGWHHIDPDHPRHRTGNPHQSAIRDYYSFLDAQIASLAESSTEPTTVLVVSDHGAKPMRGGVRINEWLAGRGWLTLQHRPREATRLSDAPVDWRRTRAWGEGGYYARIWLNLRGREPQGAVAPSDYERQRGALATELRDLPGPDGRPLGNRVVRPESVYRTVRGLAPDLMVFFADLDRRSIGTVGGCDEVLTATNDTGPDSCNHDWDGIFAMAGDAVPAAGRRDDLMLYDVAKTVLGLLELTPPQEMLGTDRSRRPARGSPS